MGVMGTGLPSKVIRLPGGTRPSTNPPWVNSPENSGAGSLPQAGAAAVMTNTHHSRKIRLAARWNRIIPGTKDEALSRGLVSRI